MDAQPDDTAAVGAMLPDSDFLTLNYGYAGEISYGAVIYALPSGPPAFANGIIVNWGLRMSDLKAMLDDLGPGYVPVTASQLNAP